MLDRLQMVEAHDFFSEEGHCGNHIVPYPKNVKSYLNPTHDYGRKSKAHETNGLATFKPTVMSAKMFIHMHHPQQQTFTGETNFVDAYLFIEKYSLRYFNIGREEIFLAGGNAVIEGKYRSCGKHAEGKVMKSAH